VGGRSLILSAGYVRSRQGGDERQVALVAEQTADGNILLGGTREPAGWANRNSAASLRELALATRRLLPAVTRLHAIRSFPGLGPCTGDGLPIIGWWPGCSGLVVAAGHDGDGVCLSARTGQVVAETVLKDSAPSPELRPERLLGAEASQVPPGAG